VHLTSPIRRLSNPRRLLALWTVGVLLFLYIPVVLIVVFSFNSSSINVQWEGFTVRWYGQLWQNEQLMIALANSLKIAAATTAVSAVLGTLSGWLLYRYQFPAAQWIRGMVFFPMIVPEIIMGVSLLLLFGVMHIELGFTTVIIAHVTFCFPFVMIAVAARLQGLDPSLEEAAMDLGATPVQAFMRVILPFLVPSIVAGALMAFTLSIDEFVVTYFTYSAASVTLPVKIYGMTKAGLNPTVNALSAMFVGATVLLAIAAEAVRRLSSVRPSIK
jgi:spermidine/putrescine transport system permease protein